MQARPSPERMAAMEAPQKTLRFGTIFSNRCRAASWLWAIPGSNVLVDHNTVFQGEFVIIFDVAPGTGLSYRNNISPRGVGGIFGSGKAEGNRSLDYYAPG